MNEVDFRNWLAQKNVNKKIISDYISRLKRIERELGYCDIDEHYENDRCSYLMQLFTQKGENLEMKKYPDANFPIGKYYMATYRYSLNQYILFKNSSRHSKK